MVKLKCQPPKVTFVCHTVISHECMFTKSLSYKHTYIASPKQKERKFTSGPPDQQPDQCSPPYETTVHYLKQILPMMRFTCISKMEHQQVGPFITCISLSLCLYQVVKELCRYCQHHVPLQYLDVHLMSCGHRYL